MNTHRLVTKHLLNRSFLSVLLAPWGFLNAYGQSLRRHILLPKAWHAPCKIISIGNITSGGTGKTPLCIALARLLQAQGIAVGVSHRGYKGKFEKIPTIVSTGEKLLYNAEEMGDEAYLLATALPRIPVVVGKQRQEAIKLLYRHYPDLQVIILDDSFQHLQVHHDLNILSFCSETGLGNGFVIPAGYLRESIAAISREDWVVIYSRNGKAPIQAWERVIAARGARMFHSYITVTQYQNARGELFPIQKLQGRSISLVSGIASPSSFEATVIGLGLQFRIHYIFPDHYSFRDAGCRAKLKSDTSQVLLCTQKDLMKLAQYPELVSRLAAVVQDYHLEGEEEFTEGIIQILKR